MTQDQPRSGVPFFTAQAVEAAVSPERALEAVRDAFVAYARDEWSMPPKVYVPAYPAGDFRAIVDVPAHQKRFEPIDRAGGGLDDWPAGHVPYAYGAYFHQYLSERFGADRVEALADATAGRLPLLGAAAFKPVLGESVSSLWRDFRASRERARPVSGLTDLAATRLTHDGYIVFPNPIAKPGQEWFYLATQVA